MAEDDEVDVLGDYSFDILNKNDSFDGAPLVSQNSDLLNCDYTIHPQWLLDKPSANPALWYNTNDPEETKQYEFDTPGEIQILPQQNSINDESGWTEKEKDLLNRGIEIFGKSNVNLSQFIGSRTPAEVKYFLKNFYSDVQTSYTSLNEDILFDANCIEETVVHTSASVLQGNEIPASVEEVIGGVPPKSPKKCSTQRKRTNSSRKCSSNDQISYENIPHGQSLLKSTYARSPKLEGNMQKLMIEKKAKVKFKTKIPMTSLRGMHVKSARGKMKRAGKSRKISSRSESGSSTNSKVPRELPEVEYKKTLRIITGSGNGVPVCEGEEVVKIIKENDELSDSDIEIDIEDEEDCKENIKRDIKEEVLPKKELIVTVPVKQETKKEIMDEPAKVILKKAPSIEDQSEEVAKELLSPEYPVCEMKIGREDISDVEKFLFFEFFEDRPTKTVQRYLTIRNHILNAWAACKPKYARKTTIRNGLKHHGDVNLIGRIHTYLEQIGAINFGCEETCYSRPLIELASGPAPPREKIKLKIDNIPRQRNRKKYLNDGEGGYTLTHDERGEIINTTVVNEEPTPKPRNYLKKPSIRLIYSRPFTDDHQQKYSICLDVSTLILMDLHAHMYLTEVMGLVGGYWNGPSRELLIKRYVPCKNIASSLTHCDMCPLSQAKAADQLHAENLDILGWYHSHPTFAPEPSQQDIDTQVSVQKWIGNKVPCVGFILSPFSLHGALIASPYRCMVVHHQDETFVPYKFKVDLVSDRINVDLLLQRARNIVRHERENLQMKSRVNFTKTYFQDNTITYLDKYIYSVKMHLAKCSNVNKMTCDAIIDGLSKVCGSSTSSS